MFINPLFEYANPLLQLVIPFLIDDRGKTLALNHRDKIFSAFDDLEHTAFLHKIPLLQVQESKYALAAFIDEIVLSSAWEERMAWMGNPLQLKFFGEHLGGEGFFKHLSELRQNGAQNIDVLEIYFLCLQWGFEGIYRLRGLEHLQALQVDFRNQIELIRGTIDPRLIPEGLSKPNKTNPVRHRLPYWIIASVTAAIIFFIYLGYALAIDRQSHKVLMQIESSKTLLLEALAREAFNPQALLGNK